MAFQSIPGQGMWIPAPPFTSTWTNPTLSSSLLIDATGEKVAFCGHVWNKDHASKTIDKVHFRFGAVTKAGGSALTVSLQDVSTATAPMQPDEAQDQFRAIANADAAFVSNTWYTSGLVTSDGTNGGSKRTVAFGERLAIVIEYDANGRLSTDSVVVSALAGQSGAHNFVSSLKTSGSWVDSAIIPNCIIEFSDGTFGTLDNTFPLSTTASNAYNQGTAGTDEICMEMSFPAPVKVDAAWILYLNIAAITNDFDVILYDGTTPMTSGTVSIDGAYAGGSGTGVARIATVTFADQITFVANTIYRLSVKPTQSTNNITIYYFEVSTANHLQAHSGGVTFAYNTRVDNGSWATAVNNRRPFFGIRVSAIDDGVVTQDNYRISISDPLVVT